jgi:hypothetical protein
MCILCGLAIGVCFEWIKAANLLIWIRFAYKVEVVIIYGFVKIIYTIQLRIRDRHEKSVENSLSELRVTTPTLSNKSSTP